MKTISDFKFFFVLSTAIIWAFFSLIFIQVALAQDAVIPMEIPVDTWGWIAFGSFFAMKLLTRYVPSTIQGMPIYNIVMKILNMLVMNSGKAKNADDLPLSIANKPPSPLTAAELLLVATADAGNMPKD